MPDLDPTPTELPKDAQRTRVRGTLGEINFGSIVDSDTGTSSQDKPKDSRVQVENAQFVIGVSISQAQTRLADPRTLAIEKAAAIEEGDDYFTKLWEQSDDVELEAPEDSLSITQPESELIANGKRHEAAVSVSSIRREKTLPFQNPSPSKAERQGPKNLDTTTNTLLKSPRQRVVRERSTSAQEGSLSLLLIQMRLQLPSIPKRSSIAKVENSSSDSQESIAQRDGMWHECKSRRRSATGKGSFESSSSTLLSLLSGWQNEGDRKGKYTPLKRTTSDDLLILQRSVSTASSLGDDSRFEHVHEMVNNRLKALKDSLNDANFKLPSLYALPRAASRRFNTSQSEVKIQSADSEKLTHRGTMRGNLLSNTRAISSANDLTRKNRAIDPTAHPIFSRMLSHLTGDVVILGGYRGSVLRSAESPNRRVWLPLKAGLNLRKVDLEVGLEDEDEEAIPQRTVPDGMLTHIGPVDISRRLLKRLRSSENAVNGKLRVHNYGYDWRFSPHRLSKQLIRFLEQLPSNQPGVPKSERGAVIIAHSLGGLITRHAVNQRPELFAGVIYAGVPQYSVNILGPIRNGDDVLFNSRILTAQVNFTVRTSYALLPLDGKCFFDAKTKEPYPVNFFDINDWIEHRWSPCINPPLPPVAAVTSNFGNIIDSFTSVSSKMMSDLPFVSRHSSSARRDQNSSTSPVTYETKDTSSVDLKSHQCTPQVEGLAAQATGFDVQMNKRQSAEMPEQQTCLRPRKSSNTAAQSVTLDRDRAIVYLTRTLAQTVEFKKQLAYKPCHTESNLYPPVAVLYGKSEPTVCGAKVLSREAIKHSDAYDDLAFASGDGVVLARAAMLPEGYRAVPGGVVATERGHLSLLGDLEGVGKCLGALILARRQGMGLGSTDDKSSSD